MQFLRIYWYRERVHVNYAEDVVILCLRLLPVAQGPQVVAQVQFTCWLYTGEDTLFHLRLRIYPGLIWLYPLIHFDRHGDSSIDICRRKQNNNKKRRSSQCRDERRKAFVVPP